jgi:hypothetical protein
VFDVSITAWLESEKEMRVAECLVKQTSSSGKYELWETRRFEHMTILDALEKISAEIESKCGSIISIVEIAKIIPGRERQEEEKYRFLVWVREKEKPSDMPDKHPPR